MTRFRTALFIPFLAAAGCGPSFGDGVALEKQGRFLRAAEEYRAFALKNPDHPSAPQALMSAAELYSVKLSLCDESRPLLERLVREYPSFKVPPDVFRRIFVCPDYFPASAGRKWVYGDSQTLGRNARQVSMMSARGAGGARMITTYFAGEQLVQRVSADYRFAGTDFMETKDGLDTLIMDYPLEPGKKWATRGPEGRIEFRVEGAGLSVKVAAGEFAGCVKISRRQAGLPSWIYEYYAPWKGKILTAVGGKGYENRVTELLSYEEK